ncbi:hypothetical protein C2E31_17830 [Rhodopirellula baltica]|nr:hypothetical protein C2E31_17830 [Rhodopirellula baltica]
MFGEEIRGDNEAKHFSRDAFPTALMNTDQMTRMIMRSVQTELYVARHPIGRPHERMGHCTIERKPKKLARSTNRASR